MLCALAVGPFLRDAYLRVSDPVYFRYLSSPPWMIWLHLLASGLGLVIGWLNLASAWRARDLTASPKLAFVHRWLGRLYVLGVILGIAAGVALVLHMRHGGLMARFGLSYGLVLWTAFTALMLRSARQRRIGSHRRWALRSYAISLAGVTLRFLLDSGTALKLPLNPVYAVATCSCFVINLAVVEMLWVRAPEPEPS